MCPQHNEEKIFEALDKIIDRNQEQLRKLCQERGLDFASLSESEREGLIDRILHEV